MIDKRLPFSPLKELSFLKSSDVDLVALVEEKKIYRE